MKEIVIGLEINSERCRTKALKTASEAKGVISVSLEEDQLVVRGDVDSVRLTTVLRKKFKKATLITVEDLNENVEDAAEEEAETKPVEEYWPVCHCNHHNRPSPSFQVVVYDPNPDTCSIV
ncbi:hypothetical protein L6164_031505 [Bauhinia variegata]|uniref:Uncharacterized protein n=1 Tax=Bauhinia variegata TaxID=167791 RepID=A0ACB9LH70_BAUVA|nr:hypothetical protein L6164_031505 [Bauhinia variegata]